ncbi:MAG: FecR family protein [Spirochaetota bacterium]|jgi:hypothetical protein|nr:FecR family protein [Spirochaetota bacterium]
MARGRRSLFVFSGILFCIIFAGLLFAAEGGTLIVRSVIGSAQYRDGSGLWRDISAGMILSPGMRVRTSAGASLDLGFDERGKSHLIFTSGTMDIAPMEGSKTGLDITLYTGRIAVSVEAAHARNLSIHAGSAQVRVKGTEFGVEYNEGTGAESGVYVFNGSVSVQGLDASGKPVGEPVIVKAGERAVVNPNGNLQPLVPVQSQDEDRFALQVAKAPEPKPGSSPASKTNEKKRSREYAPMTIGSGMAGSAGSEIIDGTAYSVLILSPRLQFGHFALGLYLPVYTEPNELLKPKKWYNYDEWNFDGGSDFIRDFLLKFMFIQWGQKHDPLYIKLGSIDDFVIGNGFLMNNFNNTLEFPANRRIGFQFDARFTLGGFELMMADVYEAKIFGGRLYLSPFTGFFNDFELGVSFVTDLDTTKPLSPIGKTKKPRDDGDGTDGDGDPDPGDGDSSGGSDPDPAGDTGHGSVFAVGVDIVQPLPSLGLLTWSVFADYAMQGYKATGGYADTTNDVPLGLNGGRGFSAGLRGRILFFDYVLAYRNLQGGFIAEYFDSFYFADRNERAKRLIKGSNNDDSYNGLVFRTGFDIKGVAYINLNFDKYYGDSATADNDNKLGLYAGLERGVIPKFHAAFMYERFQFTARDLIDSVFGERTVVTVKLYYEISKGADIVATYRRFYAQDGKYENSYSIDTQFGF